MLTIKAEGDYNQLASEIFVTALSSNEAVGIQVPDSTYVAAFEVKMLGEETYSFRDFLIDTDENNAVVAEDPNTSGDDYDEFDVQLLIQNRLSQLNIDDME